jgi:hypothetical protein
MTRKSRLRTEADLGRRTPTRKPRECILVVCEGSKTEPNYLEGLCKKLGLSTLEVEIIGEGAEINGVVAEARRLRDERTSRAKGSTRFVPFDEVWCVVDTEGEQNREAWKRGVNRTTDLKFRLAWSNPCFEYWFLLHFERTGRGFDGFNGIRPALSKHLPHYEKGMICFDRLAPYVPRAIKHSKEIHQSQWQDTKDEMDCNPGTTVHELVERILEVAGLDIPAYQDRCPLPPPPPGKTKRMR